MPKAVIIDDEVNARKDLRTLLSAHPDVTVVGEAATFDIATALLRKGEYDLVFLDVQLVGGSGFDLVTNVRPEARVIFVTAYDQFALRAFEVNALDFLQKPVRTARLAESLRRAGPPAPAANPPVLRNDDVVQVKTGPGAVRFMRVNDILLISSQDNYSDVRLTTGEHFLVRQTLSSWEERLPEAQFLRVHRQTIVNITRVESCTPVDDETSMLKVTGLAEPIRARRQHVPELQARMSGLGSKG